MRAGKFLSANAVKGLAAFAAIMLSFAALFYVPAAADETGSDPAPRNGISAHICDDIIQAQLEQRYDADAGNITLDEELLETHMGEIGYSLADREGGLSEYQQRILDACAATPHTGPHYCAAWVTYVFQNAGIDGVGGNANEMWASYCYSSDLNELEPGMLIATLHSRTDEDSDGYIYGHCGIYIGSGYVIQSTTVDGEGRKVLTSFDDWLKRYDPYGTAAWGNP